MPLDERRDLFDLGIIELEIATLGAGQFDVMKILCVRRLGAILAEVTFSDDLEGVLLLGRYRANLEEVRTGARGLLQLREKLARRQNPEKWIRATAVELRSSAGWAAFLREILDQHDPLKTILGVRDDYLGVYEYDVRELFADEYAVNRATIRLYWGVVGLQAEWMGCTVEDLTVVVLAHELPHA